MAMLLTVFKNGTYEEKFSGQEGLAWGDWKYTKMIIGLLRNASQVIIVGKFFDTVRNGKKRRVSCYANM